MFATGANPLYTVARGGLAPSTALKDGARGNFWPHFPDGATAPHARIHG